MKSLPKNILIIRTDRIGDLVLTLPLARIIKDRFPESRVSYLVREYTRSLSENNPFIDETILLDSKGKALSFWQMVAVIRKKKFDMSIIVYPNLIISLMVFFSGIAIRIGSGYRWYSFLYNKKIYEHRKNAACHELEYNVNLLTKCGINKIVNQEKIIYDLNVNKSLLSGINKLLIEEEIDTAKPIIIVHPGSMGSSVDLPLKKFKELVSRIETDGHQVILTGSNEEADICEGIRASGRIKNFAGKFNLEELIALISKCTVFVSNSTGPIHIAAALGKFVVGFYPKIVVCSKERWGPYTNRKFIYEPQIDCNNCSKQQCEELNCMDSIDINKVYSDIRNILHENQGVINEKQNN